MQASVSSFLVPDVRDVPDVPDVLLYRNAQIPVSH